MPENGIDLSPNSSILNQEEIVKLATLFVDSGVTKIRLTGGEPLVRKDILDICKRIGDLKKTREVNGETRRLLDLGMTTNGINLPRKIQDLKDSGLNLLNISLDTLQKHKFELITRRLGFERVWESIQMALKLGFDPLKINVVVMRGINDDEVLDFVELTRDMNVEIRFIEYMPFGGNNWKDEKMVSYQDMVKSIQGRHPQFGRIPEEETPSETSKLWRVPGYAGRIGFITSMSQHFCGTCNRLRITADGNMKVCLFGEAEVSLRDLMRNGADDEELKRIVGIAVKKKDKAHGGMFDMYDIAKGNNRPMILIGG